MTPAPNGSVRMAQPWRGKFSFRITAAPDAKPDVQLIAFDIIRDGLRQSELLHGALKKAGVDSTFFVVNGAGHRSRNRPGLDLMVNEFFAKHLKGK